MRRKEIKPVGGELFSKDVWRCNGEWVSTASSVLRCLRLGRSGMSRMVPSRGAAAGEGADRLTAEQIEAVIAHELAHIRRLDCFVNLFQIATETLLFYHPAVWWVSQRISAERENCCDDRSDRDLRRRRELREGAHADEEGGRLRHCDGGESRPLARARGSGARMGWSGRQNSRGGLAGSFRVPGGSAAGGQRISGGCACALGPASSPNRSKEAAA